MAGRRCCWSALPTELLSSIAKHLDDRTDVLSFRAVCSSWRGLVAVPPKSPKLPLQFPYLVASSYDVISQVTIYCIRQCSEADHLNRRSWLIKVEQTMEDNKFRVLNPFSSHLIKNLPASFPKELNLLDFRVEEMARTFSLRTVRVDGDRINENNPWFRKLTLNSDFDSSRRAIGISGENLYRMRVGNDIKWDVLDFDVPFRDITTFDRKIFTVDLHGEILGRDETTFSQEEKHFFPRRQISESERYFVKSCGHLYMVSRDFSTCQGQVHYDAEIDGFVKQTGIEDAHVPVRFKIYKRIPIVHRWKSFDLVEVNDLGDRVFFVSSDCSFSFPARDSEGFHGNCIIYVDETKDVERLDDEEREEDNGLGQVSSGKVGLYNLADHSSGPLASFPEHLAMFWPPPTWLRLDQGSSSSQLM